MKEKLDFSNLIPEFRQFLAGDMPIDSAQGFSTSIVILLLVLMTGCLLFAIWQCAKAHAQVRFYRKTLLDYKPEKLLDKRQEINEKMGSLWQEFDESLVCAGDHLYNTLDAAHFFNHYSLARGLTDNRLLAAVPSFLTAIGVIGTFAGLQIGLGEIRDAGFGSVDSGVDEIKAGIGGMIAGAAIAFMTSVWGIGSSVVFNFVEKILERSIRASISRLQNQIDSLYQRLTAEKSLADIEGHSRESREIMQTLAEQIGERMQEALIKSTDEIRNSLVESLEKILGPNIEKLADNANAGAETALTNLVERFMKGMSDEGQRQSEKMNAAAANVQGVLGDMHAGLKNFVQQLDQQMNNIAQRNRSIMEDFQSQLARQIEAQEQQGNRRDQAMQKIVTTQNKQQQDILGRIKGVTKEFESAVNHNQDVGNQLNQTANAFEEQANALRQVSQSLREAGAALAGDIRKATEAAQALMQQDQRIGARSEEMLAETRNLSQSLLSATNTLGQTAQQSTEGLQQVEQHFKALTERLQQHSEDFSEKVARLLSDYANQVSGQTSERLNQWNEQTQQYTTAMTNAIQALHEVVEEIEGKTRS